MNFLAKQRTELLLVKEVMLAFNREVQATEFQGTLKTQDFQVHFLRFLLTISIYYIFSPMLFCQSVFLLTK